jgi:uncharacterized membrane protein YvlD (DUF360 family)
MGQFLVTVLINAVALFIISRLNLGLRIDDLSDDAHRRGLC